MTTSLHTIQILDPAGEVPQETKRLAPLVQNVENTSVGFRVQWPSFDIFMERVKELLEERYGVKQVNYLYTGSDGCATGKRAIRGRSDAVTWGKVFDDFSAKSDWAILGLAA
ncbi:MAG: hypothetical protein AAB502_04990 [Chloroflexota bacterium]